SGHPTTQGLYLRGIGPSGTGRALVLLDGVPLNDPFGGWVYWNRVPLQSIEQIEVVRGGGSSVWGNYALGGVVHILTRRPVERAAFLETSFGTRDTLNVDLLLTEAQGPFRLSLEGNHFDTRGYPVVKESRRGSIDIDADSKHDTFNGRVELVESSDLSLFVTGNYFDEERGNGTPLQLNRTGSGAVAAGGRVRTGGAGEWSGAVFAHFQEFRSTFSTQAVDRHYEPPAGVPGRQVFGDIERGMVRPRVAMLVHATPTTDVRASAYQGFRVPTINELYRVFRVRNDVTTANEHLRPERLTGGEVGLQQRLGPFEARVTGFWNEVQDLIANVT